MPTLVYLTGFEAGSVAGIATGNAANRHWDLLTGTWAINGTNVRNGAFRGQIGNGANNVRLDLNTLTGTARSVVVSFGIRFDALPVNDSELAFFDRAAGNNCYLWFQDSDNTFHVDFDGVGDVAGPVAVANTWYQIDMYFDTNVNPARLQWRVDGVRQTDATDATAAADIDAFGLGRVNAANGTVSYDDLVVSITAIDYPLGPYKVLGLIADTGGTTTEIGTANATARFTGNGGVLDATHNSANILAAISETPPLIGATATGVYQRTSGAGNAVGIPMTTYTLTAGEEVVALRVLVTGWAASALANNVGLRAFDGVAETILFAAADPNFDNSTTTPAWLCKMYNPAGGWSQTKLNDLVVRFGYSTDISPQPGAHRIGAEVAISTAGIVPPALRRRRPQTQGLYIR